MTPKQEQFVLEYLIDMNATQAAIRAGYSEKTASDIGRQLLRKTPVAEAVQAGLRAKAERAKMSADEVLEELAKIGRANMADYMRGGKNGDPFLDFSALNRDQAAALAEVTVEDFIDGRGEDARDVRRVKFKLHDKRAALVDLGRHLGLFKDRVELTGKDGGPIRTTHDLSDDELAGIAATGRDRVAAEEKG